MNDAQLASILRDLNDAALVARAAPDNACIARLLRGLDDTDLVWMVTCDGASAPLKRVRKPRTPKPREVDPVTPQVLARINAGGASIIQVVEDVGINRARAHRIVNRLVADGQVHMVGKGRAARYQTEPPAERAEFANGAT